VVKVTVQGIIQMPQFDMNIYEIGTPIYVVDYNSDPICNSYGTNALIIGAHPLELRIVAVDREGDYVERTIRIGDVTRNNQPVEIHLLVKEKTERQEANFND